MGGRPARRALPGALPAAVPTALVALAIAVAVVLAACGSAGPSVQRVPRDEVITMGPSVPPTPVPSDVAAAAAALAAFEDRLNDPALTYRVTGKGSDTLVDTPVRWSLTADASSTAYEGTAKAGGDTLRFVFVKDRGWVKAKGTRWVPLTLQASAIPDIVHPWGYLCPKGSLEYEGADAAPAGSFAFTCEPGYTIQTPRMRGVGLTVTVDDLALVLRSDGTPVSLAAEGRYPGNASRYAESFTLDLAFTRVGKPVKVSPP